MGARPVKVGLCYGVCYDCKLVVPLGRPLVNHVKHLILTLATLGLWSPIWLVRTMAHRQRTCTRCGSHNVSARSSKHAIS